MPFDPSTQISSNPDVKIFFEGLLMLVPGTDATSKRCDVFVIHHHHSPLHELSVDVSVDQPQPNFPFLRLGNKVLNAGLEISTNAPSGVKKYVQGGPSVPGVFPLAEAIDFAILHPGAHVNPGGAHPGVLKIRDGVLYTATHRGADARLERQSECCDRAPIGLILGVNIDLNGRILRIKWGPGSQDFLDLPRTEDPAGTKYIIWINNSRPVPAPPEETNDFPHLYGGISGVAATAQFNLVFKKCGDIDIDSLRVPCMPGVAGG